MHPRRSTLYPLPLYSRPQRGGGTQQAWDPASPARFFILVHMILCTSAAPPGVLSFRMADGEAEKVEFLSGRAFDALVQSSGNIAEAARQLGVSRHRLKEVIDKHPPLIALLDDLRQGLIDKAESNIFADVDKGDATASRFVAQTIGKDRGWSTGISGSGKDGSIVVEIKQFSENPGETSS